MSIKNEKKYDPNYEYKQSFEKKTHYSIKLLK